MSILNLPFDNTLHSFFNDLRIYIRALLINILVLFFAIFAFLIPDQAIDLFNGIVADSGAIIIWFWLSITLLSLVMWYSTTISLYFYDLTGLKTSAGSENFINAIPYIFGISIYIIILCGFNRDGITPNLLGWYYLVAGLLTYFLIFQTRRIISKKKNQPYLISSTKGGWQSFSPEDRTILLVSSILIGLVLIVSLAVSFMEIKPTYIPQLFQTSTIICFYLSGFLMFFSVIWGIVDQEYSKLSLTLLLVILIPVFSLFNNNHSIRLVSQSQSVKDSVEADFSRWISERLDTTQYNQTNKFPIFLIAGEGGGIRAMKWTALVMNQLFEANPKFKNHVYAMSGVSGGSVGIAFQAASLVNDSGSAHQKLEEAIRSDFLSPVTFGLLFPDITQSIIPFPIDAWDRSKWLEDAFYRSFQKEFQSDVMNWSVNDYWNTDERNIPNVFFNTTSVETGQKAIISNLRLPETYFGNVIDLSTEIDIEEQSKKGIPLKTAASLSARFPIVTSAGKVAYQNNSMNIVDGGYHDNTGLETIFQLINLMINTTDRSILSRCELSVIFITNSSNPDDGNVSSSNFLIDLTAPLLTLLSNWGDRSQTSLANMRNLVDAFENLNLNIDFNQFQLDREVFVDDDGNRVFDDTAKRVTLPLGWYLSNSSNREISRQVIALTDINTFYPEKDTVALANFRTFEIIMNKIRQ